MIGLMQTEWLTLINQKKSGALPPWTTVPVVLYEDTKEKVFDIIDTKYVGDPIVRSEGTGMATYYNGDATQTYTLRFIKCEEFFNQFLVVNPGSGKTEDWARGMSRPDYIAYDLSAQRAYFVIHELSIGKIQNKRADAMKQLMNMVRMIDGLVLSKRFCASFRHRMCVVSANGCPTASPLNMADGFMAAYNNLPDPLPLSNSTIASRGFEAFQTNVVRL